MIANDTGLTLKCVPRCRLNLAVCGLFIGRSLVGRALRATCSLALVAATANGASAAPTAARSPAGGESVRLDWAAPAQCPSSSVVAAHIRRLTGADQGHDPVHATAHVTHGLDGQWRVRLVLSGAVTGTRSLQATDCASLARATALIVALSANPQVASRITEADEEAPPTIEPPSATVVEGGPDAETVAPTVPPATITLRRVAEPSTQHETWPRLERPMPRAPQSQWQGELSLLSHMGLLPLPALGAELGFGLERGRLSGLLLVGGIPWAPTGTTAPFATEREAHLGLRGCWAVDGSALEAGLCAVGKAHSVWATGHGVAMARTDHVYFASLGGGPRISWVVMPRWRAFLEADVLIPTLRPRVVVAGRGLLQETNWVTAALSAGLSLRW
jgi:hypothetical protein